MAPNEIKDDKFKCDKLAIFTAETKINPRNFRKYIIKHWEDFTEGLKENSTILFLGGVHGRENGQLGDRYEISDFKGQVISNFLSSN